MPMRWLPMIEAVSGDEGEEVTTTRAFEPVTAMRYLCNMRTGGTDWYGVLAEPEQPAGDASSVQSARLLGFSLRISRSFCFRLLQTALASALRRLVVLRLSLSRSREVNNSTLLPLPLSLCSLTSTSLLILPSAIGAQIWTQYFRLLLPGLLHLPPASSACCRLRESCNLGRLVRPSLFSSPCMHTR